ncbi:hypothetical protein YC2023_049896 [Brassica napus]
MAEVPAVVLLALGQDYLAHGETQTNPQGEVQPTDRPSLRVFKWALKHRSISVLGDQDNCDLVSRSRWIKSETCWRLSPVSLPLDHNHPYFVCILEVTLAPLNKIYERTMRAAIYTLASTTHACFSLQLIGFRLHACTLPCMYELIIEELNLYLNNQNLRWKSLDYQWFDERLIDAYTLESLSLNSWKRRIMQNIRDNLLEIFGVA